MLFFSSQVIKAAQIQGGSIRHVYLIERLVEPDRETGRMSAAPHTSTVVVASFRKSHLEAHDVTVPDPETLCFLGPSGQGSVMGRNEMDAVQKYQGHPVTKRVRSVDEFR